MPVGVALLLAAPLGLTQAQSLQTVYFTTPAAQAQTEQNHGQSPIFTIRHDLNLFNGCSPRDLRYTEISNGAGLARAQAARDNGQFAMVWGGDSGGGVAEASILVRNRDPQDRGTVKLKLLSRAYAMAGAPVGETGSGASYTLSVGYLSRTPKALVDVATCDVKSAEYVTDVLQSPPLLQVYAYDRVWLDLWGDLHEAGGMRTYVGGQQSPETPQNDKPAPLTLEVASNSGIVVSLRAMAGYGGAAVVDPIITVHPDNPDVELEILAPEGPADRHPFDGITAESLAARGIDPEPFINLGFLAPSAPSDTVPPATTPTSYPGPNANGWNNGAVKIDLAAADNPDGSGVKEVHVALAGASTGSRVETGSAASVDIVAEGETTLTYFAVDNAGNQEAAKTLKVRIDKTPPSLAGLPASGCTLWPPNHRLVQVASVNAADAGSGVAGFTLDAISNESEVGTGDGDLGPDIILTGGVVQLRAERAGNGAGRIYAITARATDKAGNVATQTTTCAVPRDRANH